VSQFYKDSIFWIEVEKIKPNPFQPRRDFDQAQLQSLADSIRQYGVLQALVVTRKEVMKEDGLAVEYELIAGERRLRASKLAGLSVVPVLIKDGDESDQMKLELAIIENLQREDLNAVDRAIAFKKLADQFGFKHATIAAHYPYYELTASHYRCA
jgi:ParB family transcriptional regulator, chromosome partitioning protein